MRFIKPTLMVIIDHQWLYSVLICDLVYKLRDLRDLYNDNGAKKILEEIESMQTKNPNSPEWETKLIQFIKERTTFLEPSDVVAIESLQKFRNLSAHPVLNNTDLLFAPNKETVQSFIINILEGILTKPPFFSNKIFDFLMADLAAVKNQIIDEKDLEKYLKTRYFKKLKELDIKKIFRSLWRVTYITVDADSNTNVEINAKSLRILFSNYRAKCLESIKNETGYYSNVTKPERIELLIGLLIRFPEVYKTLDDSLQTLITSKIESSDDMKLVGWFKKGSIKEHLASLNADEFSKLNYGYVEFIMDFVINENCLEDFLSFLIDYFSNSDSFDMSKERLDNIIEPLIPKFNDALFDKMLQVSEDNDQIYNRFGVPVKMKNYSQNRYGENFDLSKYPNLFDQFIEKQDEAPPVM